ncbi:hypothetical protein CDIK_2845 [Cucumispora dikerogammari]|nr:hypothetical protein CDIK_2845 [Cucumispora dikerogammari]
MKKESKFNYTETPLINKQTVSNKQTSSNKHTKGKATSPITTSSRHLIENPILNNNELDQVHNPNTDNPTTKKTPIKSPNKFSTTTIPTTNDISNISGSINKRRNKKQHLHIIGTAEEEEISTISEIYEKPNDVIYTSNASNGNDSSEYLDGIRKRCSEADPRTSNIKANIKASSKDKENLTNSNIKQTTDNTTSNYINGNNSKNVIINFVKYVKEQALLFIVLFLILIPIYMSLSENRELISALINENSKYRMELLKLEKSLADISTIKVTNSSKDKVILPVSTINNNSNQNFASLIKGTHINYNLTSDLHKYGLLIKWGRSLPIEVLLDEHKTLKPSECVSFSSNVGQIHFVFSKNIVIDRVVILYPYESKDKWWSSVVKDIELYTVTTTGTDESNSGMDTEVLIYESKYVINTYNSKGKNKSPSIATNVNKDASNNEGVFVLNNNTKVNNLLLKWKSNYGAGYTTFYKVFIIGREV